MKFNGSLFSVSTATLPQAGLKTRTYPFKLMYTKTPTKH